MTSKTNPGTTPVYWGFHIGDEDYKKKRYCLICQVFKPERTHHCSICNLCILNMDHHCPWVDNCIGFYNKKFFIQLLCYFFLTSFGLLITYSPYSIEIIKTMINTNKKENSDVNYKNILILLNNIILLGFTIVDFNFTKFHFKLISSNLTTIETLDNDWKNYFSSFLVVDKFYIIAQLLNTFFFFYQCIIFGFRTYINTFTALSAFFIIYIRIQVVLFV